MYISAAQTQWINKGGGSFEDLGFGFVTGDEAADLAGLVFNLDLACTKWSFGFSFGFQVNFGIAFDLRMGIIVSISTRNELCDHWKQHLLHLKPYKSQCVTIKIYSAADRTYIQECLKKLRFWDRVIVFVGFELVSHSWFGFRCSNLVIWILIWNQLVFFLIFYLDFKSANPPPTLS